MGNPICEHRDDFNLFTRLFINFREILQMFKRVFVHLAVWRSIADRYSIRSHPLASIPRRFYIEATSIPPDHSKAIRIHEKWIWHFSQAWRLAVPIQGNMPDPVTDIRLQLTQA